MGLKNYLFGFSAEDRAVSWLEENKFKIIARNFHSRFGEIDIIASKDEILHFIEVKATSGDYCAASRVTPAKMSKILKAIDYYILTNEICDDWQIDLIEIYPQRINFINNISL